MKITQKIFITLIVIIISFHYSSGNDFDFGSFGTANNISCCCPNPNPCQPKIYFFSDVCFAYLGVFFNGSAYSDLPGYLGNTNQITFTMLSFDEHHRYRWGNGWDEEGPGGLRWRFGANQYQSPTYTITGNIENRIDAGRGYIEIRKWHWEALTGTGLATFNNADLLIDDMIPIEGQSCTGPKEDKAYFRITLDELYISPEAAPSNYQINITITATANF